jgi:CO dehydrogenase/acetyl-CoA synthase beta subunit
MRANPEVLILEDDAETLGELQNHFTRKRFHPLTERIASTVAAREQPVLEQARAGNHRLGSRQSTRHEREQR